jgi:chaperonin cofactor prefoldin
MGPEFFNIYVDKLLGGISELTKNNLMMSAQISYYEKQIASLNSKVEELQKALDKASSKTKKTVDVTDF